MHEPVLAGMPVQHVFREKQTLPTLLLWVVFFMSLLDLYFLSNWLPTVLNDLGASYLRPRRSDRCCRSAAWSGHLRSAASSTASRFARWRWCILSRFSRFARSACSVIPSSSSPWRSSPPAFALTAARSLPTRWPQGHIRRRSEPPVSDWRT